MDEIVLNDSAELLKAAVRLGEAGPLTPEQEAWVGAELARLAALFLAREAGLRD